MHFMRIHVNGGNLCERNRKYQSKQPSVVEFFKEILRKKPTKNEQPKKIEQKIGTRTKMVFGDFNIVTTISDGAYNEDVGFFDFM